MKTSMFLIAIVLIASNANAKPFGSNLFTGQFAKDSTSNQNPDYLIAAGDSVNVSVWGGTTYSDVLRVDANGNILIQDLGPVKVAGVKAAELNNVVRKAASKIYTENVKIYTELGGQQKLSVFVSGNVPSPARYSGSSTDSVLHFIDKAGGVDLEKGSFRTVQLKRGGKLIKTIDLYNFLTSGDLPLQQLKDNDTIVVRDRGSLITADGDIRSVADFEFAQDVILGKQLTKLTRPDPKATNVFVSGTRDSKPYSKYLSLADFADFELHNQDKVVYSKGVNKNTKSVFIIGDNQGDKVQVLPIGAKLQDALDNVVVDKTQVAIENVYLERASVAKRQKEALVEAINNLKRSVLSSTALTSDEAKMQAQESGTVDKLAKQLLEVEPKGYVVVSSEGDLKNIELEDGDRIVLPNRTDLIMVSGEVNIPQAVVYDGGRANYYIEKAGGKTDRADRIIVIHQNRETEEGGRSSINAGDEIMVLPEVYSSNITFAKSIADILYKVAITVAVPFRIF
jgi:protein involved in polysaccharide export with SLBB domain